MELKIYQLDAFTNRLFGGNPAAICPLDAWLPDELMQQIAMENNLAETAFFVQEEGGLHLRWFTPKHEVALCGHATLAAAWVYFHHIEPDSDEITFNSLSGPLGVTRSGEQLTLDFPMGDLQPVEAPGQLLQALGTTPLESFYGEDWLVRLESEETVRALQPDMRLLQQLAGRGVIVTAEGNGCDFVSRFFAPKYGIDEDPVTGSAHTLLAPFWAERLNTTAMRAHQLSARGGELYCELRGERVFIGGEVTPYLQGVISV